LGLFCQSLNLALAVVIRFEDNGGLGGGLWVGRRSLIGPKTTGHIAQIGPARGAWFHDPDGNTLGLRQG
jgi:hypothetical protein